MQVPVVPVEGWQRHQWLDETPLPWVYPSPNMPTLETAAIYPGMCLIEGTNLSEGRGTTRPFHLVGAPWLDRARFTELCRKGAADAGLSGVAFREATFEPRFQKHAGEVCHGTEVFVTDRHAMHALLLGMVVPRRRFGPTRTGSGARRRTSLSMNRLPSTCCSAPPRAGWDWRAACGPPSFSRRGGPHGPSGKTSGRRRCCIEFARSGGPAVRATRLRRPRPHAQENSTSSRQLSSPSRIDLPVAMARGRIFFT